MRLGLGVLALAPAVFWSMTPRELDAAVRGRLGPDIATAPPTQSELGALMRRFPDA